MGILLLLMILITVYGLKKDQSIQEKNFCGNNDNMIQTNHDFEMERLERAQYYRDYESRGRKKYYQIPCPWKIEGEN